MPPLAAIERFFERLFERPSARLFRTRVQPLQIQRRIERAMESNRRPTADRTLVPNRFVVHLNPDELTSFEGEGVGEALVSGLADEALSFARAHHYALTDRPRVDLVADPTVPRADIRVVAQFAPAAPGDRGGSTAEPHAPGHTGTGAPPDPSETAVFTVPVAPTPRAILHVTDPDGRSRSIPVGAAGVTIGRAEDNDLVTRDPQVSRHHGRILGRRGTLVYLDLGSTNGSQVNGEAVMEVVLGVGDRLEVGETTIELEVEAPD